MRSLRYIIQLFTAGRPGHQLQHIQPSTPPAHQPICQMARSKNVFSAGTVTSTMRRKGQPMRSQRISAVLLILVTSFFAAHAEAAETNPPAGDSIDSLRDQVKNLGESLNF